MVLDLEHTTYDDYLRRLPKDDRAEVRRSRRRANEHGLILDRRPADASCRSLYPLFVEVTTRHGAQPWEAPVTDDVFAALGQEMPGEAFVLRGMIRDEPAGFVLCLVHGDVLLAPMMGLHYALSIPACLYAVLIDEIVRFGIEHGVRRVQLGLSNERQKSRHGFVAWPRWACLRPTPRIPSLGASAPASTWRNRGVNSHQ
jgi:predicted N-acyltransferase